MEPAIYNHGWMLAPASLPSFQQALDRIPEARAFTDFACIEPEPDFLDLFTDGACLGPQDGSSCLASWRVVLATPAGVDDFQPVASGFLPGMY